MFDFYDGTPDYEDAILARQESIEIGEDDPESLYAFYVPDEESDGEECDDESESWRNEEVEHSIPLPLDQVVQICRDYAEVFDPFDALMQAYEESLKGDGSE